MVIIERSKWLWRDRLVFFPTEQEVRQQAGAREVAILTVRQSPHRLPDEPGMISRGTSHTTCIDLTRGLDELKWLTLTPSRRPRPIGPVCRTAVRPD